KKQWSHRCTHLESEWVGQKVHHSRKSAEERDQLPENKLADKQDRNRQGAIQSKLGFISGSGLIKVCGFAESFRQVLAGRPDEPQKERRKCRKLPAVRFSNAGFDLRSPKTETSSGGRAAFQS